jgi:hypothetical protein
MSRETREAVGYLCCALGALLFALGAHVLQGNVPVRPW